MEDDHRHLLMLFTKVISCVTQEEKLNSRPAEHRHYRAILHEIGSHDLVCADPSSPRVVGDFISGPNYAHVMGHPTRNRFARLSVCRS